MTERTFELAVAGFGARDLVVTRWNGTEELSSPYRFDITVAATEIEPERLRSELLGAPACFSLRNAAGHVRRVGGVVRRVQIEAHESRSQLCWYRLELAPRLWLLSRRKTCRVFQDRSVPDIVGEVLELGRVAHRWHLQRDYPKRRYCLQYHETDLEFVQRLLAEEGLFYFFEDPPESEAADEPEVLILSDSPAAYVRRPGGESLPFRPGSDGPSAHGALQSLTLADDLRSEAIDVRHFDYERPRLALDASATVDDEHRSASGLPLEQYQYGFELDEGAVPGHVATGSLEQERVSATVGLGQSRCMDLAPGVRFAVADHPITSLAGPYVVQRVEHRGTQPDAPGGDSSEPEVYSNHLQCLPAHVPARPPRPPRTLQQVVESATVVGPEGEEIHTDELGRVKVQFQWDRTGARDEHSSCWLRVMQPWAGPSWGHQFIPRVGMEVLVAFVGGDVDHPFVLGSAYNGIHPPPQPLPQHKTRSGIRTRSTPGGQGANELWFEDAAQAEQIFLHAQRDLEEQVRHDHRRSVGHDETLQIHRHRTATVGGNSVRTVEGNEITTVERNQILHVVGKQLIIVDGESPADDEPTRSEPVGDSTPVATTAERAALPSLDDLLGPPPDRTAQQAVFVWRQIELAPAFRSAGDALQQQIEQATQSVEHLREQASEFIRHARSLPVPRDDDPMRHAHLGAVYEARRRAAEAQGQCRGLIQHLTHTLSELRSPGEESLEAVRAEGATVVRALIAEAESLGEGVARQIAAVCEPFGLPPEVPAESDDALSAKGRVAGEEAGGAGATEGFEDVGELTFKGAVDEQSDSRGEVKVKGGSRVQITGGGEIASKDGFRIASEDCGIELCNGVVTLSGKHVEIAADSVTIAGKGLVKITGSPILLN